MGVSLECYLHFISFKLRLIRAKNASDGCRGAGTLMPRGATSRHRYINRIFGVSLVFFDFYTNPSRNPSTKTSQSHWRSIPKLCSCLIHPFLRLFACVHRPRAWRRRRLSCGRSRSIVDSFSAFLGKVLAL